MPKDDVDMDELKLDTLSGDLRDAMLMRVRDMKRPWSMMTEQEQRETAKGLETAARHLVRGTIRLLTDYETFMGEREPAEVDPDQPELPGGPKTGEAA